MRKGIEQYLTEQECETLASLTSPTAIQAYLDSVSYADEDRSRCPAGVMHERRCHCYDGGMFAAMALRRLGYLPRVIVLLPDWSADDDHMLAVYRRNGRWGAVAKSAYVGLRSREPVYHTLRELAMSYFQDYFNPRGQRTMLGYTSLLNLWPFDKYGWEWDEAGSDRIIAHLPRLKKYITVTPELVNELNVVDAMTHRAGMLYWGDEPPLPQLQYSTD